MQKTPTQQALIQFVESIIITAIIAGIVSVSSALTGTGSINWREVGLNFGLAVAFSLAHSLTAYLKAMPSQPGQIDLAGLGAAIETMTGIVQQRTQAITQPLATPTIAQPVHGPGVSVVNSNSQPATTSIQTQTPIPAFTPTAQIPVVSTGMEDTAQRAAIQPAQ